MEHEAELLEITKRYLDSLGSEDPEQKLAYFADDVVQEEYPNRLVPNGATRDLDALREGARRGRAVMAAQRMEVLTAIASGSVVAVEALWVGTLAVPFGSIPVCPFGGLAGVRP
jgi:hypothetical protein